MIFPIGDDQVKGGYFPFFAYSFIALNVVAYFFQMQYPNLAICEFGAVPDDIVAGKNYYTLFTSMFMHGSIMHLVGNMLFLWVFADNIEATVGSFKFVIFYVLGGMAASLAHIYLGGGTEELGCCYPCGNAEGIRCLEEQVVNMCAGSIPTVGASGAISAVLGAYLVMFPHSSIKVLVLVFFRSFRIPAYIVLGLWIGMQLFSGFSEMGQAAGGGTAWWAHIGGFIFGITVGLLLRGNGGLRKKDIV